MKVNVCFVCLKTVKNRAFKRNADGKDVNNLYFKFWRFAGGYLGIESGIDKESAWTKECFCDECKNVVSSLCQLYRQLLQVQLHLSSKLGELLKLMESSESGVSHKLGRSIIKSLAEQLGFAKRADVDELRSLLKEKCKVKSQEELPEILLHREELPPSFASLAENVKVEIIPDDVLEADDDDDYAHASPLVEDEDIHSSSSEENSNQDDGAPPKRSIDTVRGARGVESESEIPEIKIEPLEVEEQEMDDDDKPMYETKRKEESDSDSTFEPGASPEHNSNESDSDSQSDREPASIKSNAKSPRAHHQPPKEENRKQNQCQHCGKVLISSQRLRHHIYQVHRGHPFQCAECSKSFKTKAALKYHAIRTHSETIKSDFKVKKLLKREMKSTASTDAVSGTRGVDSESDGKIPEIKIEPLEVDEQDFMNDDDEPMCETKRKEESDSDSTFEPDDSPEHNSNVSESDSQSDWKPEEKSKKVKPSSTSTSKKQSPHAHNESPKKENRKQNQCVCQHCGKVLISSQRLRHHVYQVHRGHPFHCTECSKSFKTKAALKYHTISHSAETIKSDLKVKKRLNIVIKSTTSTSSSSNVPGEGDFICPTCSKDFATQEKIAQHINKAHSKKKSNSVKTEPIICEKCGKTFANSNSRRLHVSRIHGNQDESPCPYCGKIFRSAYRLTRHINFTHSDKRYKCDECGVELKSKVLLNNHIIAFHKPEAHGCAECGKVFKSQSYLQGHIDYVHRGILKRYSCPNCVIVYSHRNKLNRHLLKCTKERPLYVKTSKSPGAHNHFRTVVRWDDTTGPDADGKFPCPKCPKIFETAPKRSAHVRHTHLNVNHTCGECGVVRKSKHNLERHIDACHRQKDQVCPHCGKTLATGYIPIHIKLVHPELAPEPRARVQCPGCPEGFYTKRQLEKHLLECVGNNHRSEQNTAMECNHSVTIL